MNSVSVSELRPGMSVKGHAGMKAMKIADQLAIKGIEEFKGRIMRQVILPHLLSVLTETISV